MKQKQPYANKTITVRESTYYTLLAIKKRCKENQGQFVSFSDLIDDMIEMTGRIISDRTESETIELAQAEYQEGELKRIETKGYFGKI